jgi:PAS domain S-box-containing protein
MTGVEVSGAIVAAALDAVVVIDATGHVLDWNPAAETIFGYTREETLGREVADLIVPGPLRLAHRNALARHVQTGETSILGRRIELTAVRSDGSEFPIELAVTRLQPEEPVHFAGFIRDLTGRRQPMIENRRLQERMAFLAQAGLVLDQSLDYRETLHRLADVTIPELAQLTIIDLVDQDGTIHTAVASASEVEYALELERMREAHPLDFRSPHPVVQVLRSRKPTLLAAMEYGYLRTIAQGSEHLELMRRLQYHSAIVVPLIARGDVIGTLSLLRMRGSPEYDRGDLVLAEELARRAAMSVENARLFESTRRLARTLQDSLLPRELPEIPGVRIVARYLAAQEGQEVGGDFYDAFAIGRDRWGIAIGDVCGKGAEAASLTARARYTIRALAGDHPAGDHSGGDGTASVLSRLNDAVSRDAGAGAVRLLTALFAIVAIQDGALHAELAAAGHPPPLVLRSDGTVEIVRVGGPLIGVRAGVEYQCTRVILGAGDTMLLYTDGLTDARAPARILSESDLAALLERGHGFGAERLASFVEGSATEGRHPRDDIAILVIEHSIGTATTLTNPDTLTHVPG